MKGFESMFYYIEDIPEGENVVERFADLSSLADVFLRTDDLPEGVDADKVMRYLIYMFSPNTPLRREIPDFNSRKKFVLKKINVDTDEHGNVSEGYALMCAMNEDWIVDRFIKFTKLFRSVEYEKLAVADARKAQLTHFILTSKVDKSSDDANIQKGLKGWEDDIRSALEEILQGEKSKAIVEKISFSIKMDNLGIRPEEYTRFYKDNKYLFNEIIP